MKSTIFQISNFFAHSHHHLTLRGANAYHFRLTFLGRARRTANGFPYEGCLAGNTHDVKPFHSQSAALDRVGFWTGRYCRAMWLDRSLQNGHCSQCQTLDPLPLDLIRRIFEISFFPATLHIAHPKSSQTCLELQQSRRPVRNAGLHRLDLGSLRAGYYRNSTRYSPHGLRCSTPIAVAKAGIPAQSLAHSARTMEAQSSFIVSFRLAH